MSWLKRHFLLAIGALIALLLLAVGTWYLLGNISRNTAAAAELDEQKHRLDQLFAKDPFPHRTNIDAAKREIGRVRTIIQEARQSFTPVAYENVNGQAFKTLLDNTLDELHKKADKASVALPGKTYEFSFMAQKKGLKFSPASFPKINVQLAEVKTICNLLFDAKINRLVNIKRVRASTDDPPGSPDYLENRNDVTNDVTGAILSPYQVEFNCFSSEMAAALEGFYKSPHGLLVKALLVEALPQQQGAAATASPPPPVAAVAPPTPPPGSFPPGQRRPPGVQPRPGGAPLNKEGLETVLNEKLLKVILLITVVKPGTAAK
jgi:hypothetical protein